VTKDSDANLLLDSNGECGTVESYEGAVAKSRASGQTQMTFELELTHVLLAVVAFIAASIAWARWEVRRRRAKTAREMTDLGFEPANASDPGLSERLKRLHRSGTDFWNIAIAWKRDEPDGRVYVFDLWVERNEQRILEGGYILIVSPRLDLPRFGILPKIQSSGVLPALASRFQKFVVNRLGPVPFDDHPEFDRAYSVVGDDQVAIRQFLTDARLRELSRRRVGRIEAGGDSFSYFRGESQARGRTPSPTHVRNALDEARAVCRAFQG
jgi:hypothetical protein